MLQLRFLLSILFCGVLSLLSINTNAAVNVIIGSPPPARVVVLPPPGYSNCPIIPGRLYGNVWIPPHQECSYSNGLVWVAPYWGCVRWRHNGMCTRWTWVQPRRVYRAVPRHRYYAHPRHYRHGGGHDRHWHH